MKTFVTDELMNTLFELCDKNTINVEYLKGYFKRCVDKGTMDNLDYIDALVRVDEYQRKKACEKGGSSDIIKI